MVIYYDLKIDGLFTSKIKKACSTHGMRSDSYHNLLGAILNELNNKFGDSFTITKIVKLD